MSKKFFITALILLIGCSCLADSKHDSLRSILPARQDTLRVIILNKLSFEYLLISSYDTAASYGTMAFELSEKLGYKRGKAKSLINKGNVFLARSEYDSAKSLYLLALSIARGINDVQVTSHSLNNLGEACRMQSDYPGALSYYLEGLRIDEKAADKTELAASLNNIGLLYSEINEFRKANEYLQRSLTLSREVDNAGYISTNLLNIGETFRSLGQQEDALKYFREALNAKKAQHDEDGIAICLTGIGNVMLETGQPDSALFYFEKSLALAGKIGEQSLVGSNLNNIGVIHSKRGEFAEAAEYHTRFLALATKLGIKKDISDAYLNLASDYAGMKDFKRAYEYQQKFSAANDSLFSVNARRAIAELETRYKREQDLLTIEALKNEKEFRARIDKNQKMLLGGAVMLAFAVGFVFYFRAQVGRQKNIRLTERVDAQNRELSTVALLVNKKNQAFNDLKSKLSEVKSEPARLESSIHSIIRGIDKEINFDVEWDTFKYHFEKVHPGFFAKLQEASPSLGDKELRFCAYVKSNLTTKEIARLTGSTVRSVQQTRYRINQKLATGMSLGSYLRKI